MKTAPPGRRRRMTQAYNDSLRRDPMLAWTAVKSSFANLSSVMFGTGQKESPVAVALVHIANGINMVAGAFERHPILGKAAGLLMGVGLAGATLKTLGISLRFIRSGLSIITGPLRFLGTAFMDAFGPSIVRAILTFGPRILTAIGALSSFVGEGLMAAFALLSNPVGWTILAVAAVVAAGVLIYKFRDQIGAGLSKAWGAIKGAFLALPWQSIGWAVADFLTAGLASKLPGAIDTIRAHLPTWAGGTPAPNAPKVAGHRALGGPVWGGRMYLVGEHGPELWRAPASGSIVPARPTQRLIAASARNGGYRDRRDAGGATINAYFTIQDAHDPRKTARVVHQELKRLERSQAVSLTD